MPQPPESQIVEVNIDSLPGPSHHFGGLGVGNLASMEHRGQVSSPQSAALQSLDKARRVSETGTPQFLWLPPVRPNLEFLRSVGFGGSDADVLKRAGDEAPDLLSAAYSGAFLWTANSGTFTCGRDAIDGSFHFTPANLISSLHRHTETADRESAMRSMFATSANNPNFDCHPALPSIVPLRDEGAANHMRLCDPSGSTAINVFVYGEDSFDRSRFLPRQTLKCCQAIARQHHLVDDNTFYLAQKPEAIAAGAFHNDVVATSHYKLVLFHEDAFEGGASALESAADRFGEITGQELLLYEVSRQDLTLSDAIESYLFNSQIVGTSEEMTIFCPQQCQQIHSARRVVDQIVSDTNNPIRDVEYVQLDQSMSGGGGPACVRLRVPLAKGMIDDGWGDAFRLTPSRIEALQKAVVSYYPHELSPRDLASAEFLQAAGRAREATIQAMQ